MPIRQPAKPTLERAIQLGQLMANSERRIRPDLSKAHHSKSYLEYIQAHRHRLEQLKLFERWEGYVTRLVEREELLQGVSLNFSQVWDEFHRNVALPVRCAFWFGWEEAVGLRSLYEQQVAVSRSREAMGGVLRVAGGTELAKPAQDMRPEGHDPTGMVSMAAEDILASMDAEGGVSEPGGLLAAEPREPKSQTDAA